MIIDTSALIAILQGEEGSDRIVQAIADARRPAISSATLVEASIVADGPRDPVRSARFDAMVRSFGLDVVPLTAEHVRIARSAFRDYGRGSGHPAKLNFGDCLTYALAAERDQPLLYVGDDFAHTDLRSALDEPEV
ncbi:type II toxin-antitoxin system VapC family toxin [Microbacterium sp. C7(2022)]|uniref:type II toxin-antitoxin system VapC family toxin n=1 Tax=Microbacterium sp. C7(2022) TaxID=2992759 RepID=UPI00237BC958|nr:type II toxin-antitoxin system VapC family toxin [Microbacterium sp. C7(2022)]MDE0545196.1 type II toxin-antitoxin system VapC family toxin [Microbacterium sp. C7(2022)]